MSQSASQTAIPAEYLPEKTLKIFESYNKLGTDDKLALLYLIYKKMGDSVTPAAPAATEPELAPILMVDFYSLSHDNQLNVMRDIVNGVDTEYSRAYGALKENNQLMAWFAWAQAMEGSGTEQNQVVGLPTDYKAAESVTNALGQIEALEFEEQISLLREVASNMGYSEVLAIPTQAETGKTASL